jgi:putative SOS response-associated peptidase YedK
MCGRFLLKTSPELLQRAFGFVELPNLRPRYNIAPTDETAIVRQRREPPGERSLSMLRWGLVPPWEKDLKNGARNINARAETLLEKPSFRKPFERRRCLVLADGFYEWRKEGKERIPFLITRRDEAPFAFAGLWDRWWPDPADRARYVDTFTVVTTEANTLLRPLHDRMPVVLAAADHATWLDREAEPETLRRTVLRPAPEDALAYVEVEKLVNNVKNDEPALLAPKGERHVLDAAG